MRSVTLILGMASNDIEIIKKLSAFQRNDICIEKRKTDKILIKILDRFFIPSSKFCPFYIHNTYLYFISKVHIYSGQTQNLDSF